jgi:predicted nucleic acid-binding protein
MSALVVDASAALALMRSEQPAGREVLGRLHDQALAGEPILVPTLFWLEVVNVLARPYRYPPAAIVEAVYELEQIGLATAEVGRPGTLAIIDVVGRTGLTAYDAAYLVLAESTDAALLTADATLAAAAGEQAILAGESGGIAEAPGEYAGEPAWTGWRGATAYLRELRGSSV